MRVRSVSEIWDHYHHVVHGHEERRHWSKYQCYPTPKARRYDYNEEAESFFNNANFGSIRTVTRKSLDQTEKINKDSARNDNFIRAVRKSLGPDWK